MAANKKQLEFIKQYFLCGKNASMAYRAVYKGVKNSVARQNASELLAKPYIQDLIQIEEERLAEKYNITQEKMIDELRELIYSCQTRANNFGESIDHKSWAKALDMLAKLTGQYSPDKIELIGNINIKLNEEEESNG